MAAPALAAQACAHGERENAIDKPGSNAEGRHDGGALALIAICGLVVAVGLMVATFDRLGTLVPMARAAATQAVH